MTFDLLGYDDPWLSSWTRVDSEWEIRSYTHGWLLGRSAKI